MTELEPRARLQLLIAMAGDCAAPEADRHEAAARAAGLSGAEIDAARARRSFDARVNAAIALACAVRHGADWREAEARCAQAGFDAGARALIIGLGKLSAEQVRAMLGGITQ
ncbi:MAG: hypothetical protein A4S12_10990 [Proteobacteria bacterium SG_bin5]|nr:hypothetical protein [Sphingomonas sp.]OQW39943.1 MAG: hypothetical protein A4S12_10990 [Proteobacteria bacterium SG_bin5]